MVAYRKATISLADEVLHLDEGRIAGRGTHDQLLATSPAYAQLVNAYEDQPEDQPDGGPDGGPGAPPTGADAPAGGTNA